MVIFIGIPANTLRQMGLTNFLLLVPVLYEQAAAILNTRCHTEVVAKLDL